MSTTVAAFHTRSIEDKERFWAEQADTIDWFKRPDQILDFSTLP